MFPHSSIAKHVSVVARTAGDNTLVAAVDGHKIRVVHLILVGSGDAVEAYLHDGAASPNMLLGDASNKLTIDKAGVLGPSGYEFGPSEAGLFNDTADDTGLILNLSAANAVPAIVTYVLVQNGQPW